MSERIITAERSIITAADVRPDEFKTLVEQLGGIGLGGVKVGFEVGLGCGLRQAGEAILETDESIRFIYDHQKAGNDIPATGKNFARAMDHASVDAAILFPFTGDDVEESWVKDLQEVGVGVIVGAEMTHPGIHDRIKFSAFQDIFVQAIDMGVTDFVVPGNKPDRVAHWKQFFDENLGESSFDLYAPGFVTQGGSISEAGEVAGKNFHAIVGSAIYANKEDKDPRSAAQEMIGAL